VAPVCVGFGLETLSHELASKWREISECLDSDQYLTPLSPTLLHVFADSLDLSDPRLQWRPREGEANRLPEALVSAIRRRPDSRVDRITGDRQ